jgi:hypothetical protein
MLIVCWNLGHGSWAKPQTIRCSRQADRLIVHVIDVSKVLLVAAASWYFCATSDDIARTYFVGNGSCINTTLHCWSTRCFQLTCTTVEETVKSIRQFRLMRPYTVPCTTIVQSLSVPYCYDSPCCDVNGENVLRQASHQTWLIYR